MRDSHEDDESLVFYGAHNKQSALLSADEEIKLAQAIAQGDINARTTLAKANLGLVISIARRFIGRGMERGELIAEGYLGALRATEDFDPIGHGTRFSDYAPHWIQERIRHALSQTTDAIRLPPWVIKQLTTWRRAERILSQELGAQPTDDQIAERLRLSPQQVSGIIKALRARHVLRERVSADEERWSPFDLLARADDSQQHEERREDIRELVELIHDPQDKKILILSYGLDGEDPLPSPRVGERLGMTGANVRLRRKKALEKIGLRLRARQHQENKT